MDDGAVALDEDDGVQDAVEEDQQRRRPVELLDGGLHRSAGLGGDADEEAGNVIAGHHGSPRRAGQPTAVTDQHDVLGQGGLERRHIPGHRGEKERCAELYVRLRVDGEPPRRVLSQPGPGPPVQLPAVRIREADDLGDVGVRVVERVAQHADGALGSGEPLEEGERGQAHRFALLDGLKRAQLTAEHRLGQPRPDVRLAPGTGTAELVQAEPGHDRGQERSRITDLLGRRPPKPRRLHHVLGVRGRSEHPVRDREQPLPVRLEDVFHASTD
jgi:hypothetical protein